MVRIVETNKPKDSKPLQYTLKAYSSRPEQLRKLLRRKSGASIAELREIFGWQPHTARAAISGLRKAGEAIERRSGRNGSIYRIVKRAAGK